MNAHADRESVLREVRRRNALRTALILASVVATFFLGVMIKQALLGH